MTNSDDSQDKNVDTEIARTQPEASARSSRLRLAVKPRANIKVMGDVRITVNGVPVH